MRKNFRKNFSNITSSKTNHFSINRKDSNNDTIASINKENKFFKKPKFKKNFLNKNSNHNGLSENTKTICSSNNYNKKIDNNNSNTSLNKDTIKNRCISEINKDKYLCSSYLNKTTSNINISNNRDFEEIDEKNPELKTRKINIRNRNSTTIKNSYKFDQEYIISVIENLQ